MEVFPYRDYDHYVEEQIKANKAKLNLVYVRRDTINRCHDYQKMINPNYKEVLCHGTRNASEQIFFLVAKPDLNVIGSEISDTATQFPHTIQWDFNKINPDWINRFDVVYSNAFDHTPTPEETLKVWLGQLNDQGRLYIEWSNEQNNMGTCESDPLNATTKELTDLIEKCNGEVEYAFKSGKHNGTVLVIKRV